MLLPILLLLLFGSFEVWRLVSTQESLHAGVYQATRFVAVAFNHNSQGLTGVQPVAEELVARELWNNELVRAVFPRLEDVRRALDVEIESQGAPAFDCWTPFTVQAEITFPNWPVIFGGIVPITLPLARTETGLIVCTGVPPPGASLP